MRNDKTTKVAERKLVLRAEFFFTAFNFDLVLTAQVFCVVLHRNFGIELFHLEIHSLYICETPHKNGYLVEGFYKSTKLETNFFDTFTRFSKVPKVSLKNISK